MLNQYDGSLVQALNHVYPTLQWDQSKFSTATSIVSYSINCSFIFIMCY